MLLYQVTSSAQVVCCGTVVLAEIERQISLPAGSCRADIPEWDVSEHSLVRQIRGMTALRTASEGILGRRAWHDRGCAQFNPDLPVWVAGA
jgi:hypothetical protein